MSRHRVCRASGWGWWIVGVAAALSCSPEANESGRQESGQLQSATVENRVAALRARFPDLWQDGPGMRLEREADGRVRGVRSPDAKRRSARTASVELPERANGWVRLEDDDSGLSVRFALRAALDVPIDTAGGTALYEGALSGSDVLHRVLPEGTEDYVVFETAPAPAAIVYDVDVSAVAGLRMVGGTLEFLDGQGAPRLRVASPYVIDVEGRRHAAEIDVEGCAHDVDPSPPWGRAVTPPGAEICTIGVRWDGAVRYPAVLDPAWVNTGSMTHARYRQTATVLGSGNVLIAGGRGPSSAPAVATAELYNPTSGTFAATGFMSWQRHMHTASLLPSGKVLVAGGEYTVKYTSTELYDPATGTFTAGASMATGRSQHTATTLPSGQILFAGGEGGTTVAANAELYDPTTGTFSATGKMSTVRTRHTASMLSSGNVLMAGGYNGSVALTSAELYDPAAGTFTATGTLLHPQYGHGAAVLGTGKVLLVGGVTTGNKAELFDPATETFSNVSLIGVQGTPSVTLLPSGKVLLASGSSFAGGESTAVYDPIAGTFQDSGDLNIPRAEHAATLLPSGKVLVSGGYATNGGSQASAELFEQVAPGGTCLVAGECVSGVCNNGYCCAGACSGSCLRCASGTGACVPVTNADDPDTCTNTNTCDASGVCKKKNGQTCTTGSTCASTYCVNGYCCNNACSGSCNFCSVAGSEGTCTVSPGSPGSPSCGGYLCGSSANCPTSCTSDAGCAPTHYCAASNTCQPRKTTGAACDLAAGKDCEVSGCRACASDHCVDGYCCDTACAAACDVCSASLGAPANGTCAPADTGTHTAGCNAPQACNGVSTSCPTGCTQDADCALTHYCSKGGACLPRKSQGQVCDQAATGDCQVAGCRVCTTNHCVDGFCCDSGCGACGTCAGAALGTCSPKPAQSSPGGAGCGVYKCDGASATCPTSCAGSGYCIPGYYCDAGACVAKLPQGSSCTAADQCSSGFCSDGVCCDGACAGVCMACSAANKQSGTASGTCGVAKQGSNPGNQCVVDTTNVCGTIAACKGTSAECAQAPAGTSCGPTSCVSGNVTGQVCSGQGSCQQNVTVPCAPYKCQGSACTSPCIGDGDCETGNYCTNGTCVAQADNGKGCSQANQCKSGFCVDGVCCDAPCNGQCEACDASGNLGKCVTVTGAPHGSRPPCNGSGLCQGTCDGTNPTVCSFPALATTCTPAACEGDVSQPAGYCDGAGACATPTTKTCLPYGCNAGSGNCKTSCTSDADCAQGAKCDTTSGKCAVTSASCKDAFTVLLPNGQEQSCEPYQCVAGACLDACSASADCAPGYECAAPTCVKSADAGPDGAAGTSAGGSGGSGTGGGSGGTGGGAGAGNGGASGDAGAAGDPEAADDGGGCGCRAAGSHDPRSPWGAALLFGAVAIGARRARSRSRPGRRTPPPPDHR